MKFECSLVRGGGEGSAFMWGKGLDEELREDMSLHALECVGQVLVCPFSPHIYIGKAKTNS